MDQIPAVAVQVDALRQTVGDDEGIGTKGTVEDRDDRVGFWFGMNKLL